LGCLDGRILAIDIYGITYGIKNADGILPGGSDMVNVSKDLSRELTLLGTPCILEGVGSRVKMGLSETPQSKKVPA
jgi:hypothetical protein